MSIEKFTEDGWSHYNRLRDDFVARTEAALDEFKRSAEAASRLAAITLAVPQQQAQTLSERFRLKLAATGFAQVIFVAANTVFIAHYALMANLLTAFAISWVWSFNVKKIAFGTNADRWAYAIGAACGSLVGNVLATHLIRWLE